MAKPNKAYWSIFSMLRRMYENSPSPSYSAENQVGVGCGGRAKAALGWHVRMPSPFWSR